MTKTTQQIDGKREYQQLVPNLVNSINNNKEKKINKDDEEEKEK